MVEHAHRQLKDALHGRVAGVAWPDHLPWILLGLRAAPKEDSSVSSAELVFGAPLSLPRDFLDSAEPPVQRLLQLLSRNVDPVPIRPLSYAQAARKPLVALWSAAYVYVCRGGHVPPLAPLYVCPYKVLSREEKYFTLQIGEKADTVSVDRLKPHLGEAPVHPASPPARGRPPASSSGRDSSASPP
jgi:hypothetical protein